MRRAEGGANIFGVFRVKNHDFTPKNHIFPILGGAREIFGVFHVKNHDLTPKKIIFLPILGGARAGCAPLPPESAPEQCIIKSLYHYNNNDYDCSKFFPATYEIVLLSF